MSEVMRCYIPQVTAGEAARSMGRDWDEMGELWQQVHLRLLNNRLQARLSPLHLFVRADPSMGVGTVCYAAARLTMNRGYNQAVMELWASGETAESAQSAAYLSLVGYRWRGNHHFDYSHVIGPALVEAIQQVVDANNLSEQTVRLYGGLFDAIKNQWMFSF